MDSLTTCCDSDLKVKQLGSTASSLLSVAKTNNCTGYSATSLTTGGWESYQMTLVLNLDQRWQTNGYVKSSIWSHVLRTGRFDAMA